MTWTPIPRSTGRRASISQRAFGVVQCLAAAYAMLCVWNCSSNDGTDVPAPDAPVEQGAGGGQDAGDGQGGAVSADSGSPEAGPDASSDASPACSEPCPDVGPCKVGACLNGVCGTVPAVDGTACSDGNPCTSSMMCMTGVCQGGMPTCPVPSEIQTGMVVDTALGGDDSPSISKESCPAGQVLIGLNGRSITGLAQQGHQWVWGVTGICASVSFKWNAGQNAYDVVTTQQSWLSEQHAGPSGYSSSAWKAKCPSGQLLAGYYGVFEYADYYISTLGFRCEKFNVVYSASTWQLQKVSTVDLGVVTPSVPVITEPIPVTDCEDGSLAVGLNVATAGSMVHGFGLQCAPISLSLSP